MELEVLVSVDFSPLITVLQQIASDLQSTDKGPMADAKRNGADDFMGGTRERFAEQSTGGGAWSPNAQSTIERWNRKQQGGVDRRVKHAVAGGLVKPILIDTGEMQASLTRGNLNYYETQDADSIEFGTEDPKANYHQQGTSRMSQRTVMVPIDDPTMPDGVSGAIGEHLAEGLQKIVDAAIGSKQIP